MRGSFAKLLIAVFCMMASGTVICAHVAYACTWDSSSNKCLPEKAEVVVYKHASCNGPDYFAFKANNQTEYADLNKLEYVSGTGSLNDSISCYVVGPKTVFRFYDYVNYGGKSVTISNNSEERTIQKKLGREWWNDKISSVKVFANIAP